MYPPRESGFAERNLDLRLENRRVEPRDDLALLDDRVEVDVLEALHDARDLAALEQRGAELDVAALADHEDLIEFDSGAEVGGQLLDSDDVAFGDAILLAARRNDRVHDFFYSNDGGREPRQKDAGF